MAILVLSINQSFNPGADLWVVPDFQHSKMSTRLDWFNNFLVGKVIRNPTPELSETLKFILKETELPEIPIYSQIKNNTSDAQDILISSENQLPNRWTAYVPYHNNNQVWCEKILKLYLNLKKPTLRIFLPTNLSMNDFVEAWRSVSSNDDFSIVVEN